MSRRHLLRAALIAIAVAAVPLRVGAGADLVELSTAACAEAGCGGLSVVDCFCPDIQMPNHRPRCDE